MLPFSSNPKVHINPLFNSNNNNYIPLDVSNSIYPHFDPSVETLQNKKIIHKNYNLEKSCLKSKPFIKENNPSTSKVDIAQSESSSTKLITMNKFEEYCSNSDQLHLFKSLKNNYKWKKQFLNSKDCNMNTNHFKNKGSLNNFEKFNNLKISCKLTFASFTEHFVNNHNRYLLPFFNVLCKGWFFHDICDTKCIDAPYFDLKSCCFISQKYLPQNTINVSEILNKLNKLYTLACIQRIQNQSSTEEKNDLISLSKHKLIRNQNQPNIINRKRKNHENLLKIHKSTNDSSIVFCNQQKLIRGNTFNLNKKINEFNSNVSELRPVPPKLEKSSYSNCKSSFRRNYKKDSKLIRKHTNSTNKYTWCQKENQNPENANLINSVQPMTNLTEKNSEILPEKLVSFNQKKFVKISCLQKNTKHCKINNSYFMNSLLYHMIQNRRRSLGSSHVLLNRSKLMKKLKFKNRTWKKSVELSAVKQNPKLYPEKLQNSNKIFVSIGNKKLIRKTLFTKRNKDNKKNNISTFSLQLRTKVLPRLLKSQARRIQIFTNHLTRLNLKYIRDNSSISKNRYVLINKFKSKKFQRKKRKEICPIYRKTGVCSKLLNGDCNLKHDSKFVSICNKYLKGNCGDKNCQLSHDIIPQKVPVCIRFLKDNCKNNDCSYSHVKLDVNAPICSQFLQGYCEAAEKCTSWHLYACPQYKKSLTCDKGGRCKLQHRSLDYFKGKESDSEEDVNTNSWRYFEKNKLDPNNSDSLSIIPQRQILGILPEYIPLS